MKTVTMVLPRPASVLHGYVISHILYSNRRNGPPMTSHRFYIGHAHSWSWYRFPCTRIVLSSQSY